MRYVHTCTENGCGFRICATERKVAGAWLFRHRQKAHPLSREMSLQECEEAAVFKVGDNGPIEGMPWQEVPSSKSQESKVEGAGQLRVPF